MERSETRQLVASARAAAAGGQPVALATIVRVLGSAYRREGAGMLVREDGAQTCMLSGGCLEGEVVEVALEVIAGGEAKLARYDLGEDVVWGLGIGCGGSLDILIERVTGDALLEAWLDALEDAGQPQGRRAAGGGAVLVTPLAGAAGRLLVPEAGPARGDLRRGGKLATALTDAATAHARALLALPEAPSGARTFAVQGRPKGLSGEAELFFTVSHPAPELVIFGAGHDALPLAQLAGSLGYDLRVVDARAGFLTPGRFPGAALELLSHEDFAGRLELGPRSHAVIMNHHLERDRAALRFALESPSPYVGVLGPRSRFEKLLDGLAEEGFAPGAAQLARVRAPVGLRIGAETPEEVALSIAGELMALRRAQGGGFLNGEGGRIHAPTEPRVSQPT